MPITLQALFAPDRRALQFAIKTLLGGGLALWLALRWGLEQPAWALMTAFIVAQPLSGMVVQKGLARLLGTLVGTIMSVVFMGLFAQTPWLFLLALALWLGLCTASSTLLRSAWSYSFVLAGYTVAIIALPALAHPLTVFDQAVARCTEICLGILCATAASALLWPMRVERQLADQARAAWHSGMNAARATLAGDGQARKGLLEILGRIVAVDAQREHAWFEGSLGRQRARSISGLSQKLLMLLRIARSVRRQWKQLEPQEAEQLRPWMSEVQEALASPDNATLQALRPRLLDASHDPLISSAQSFCLARFTLLLDTALAASAALKAVEEGKETVDPPRTLAPHRDLSLALVFGARSALAFLVVSCFWLATAWPAASGALLLTCVVCSLFASRENGAQIGMSFMRGIFLAIPAAFFVGQILLPQWSSFALLCLGMGVPLFFGALGMANPQIGATATSFCLHFIVLGFAAQRDEVRRRQFLQQRSGDGDRRGRGGAGVPFVDPARPGVAWPPLAGGDTRRSGAPDPAQSARCRKLVWRAHGRPFAATGAALSRIAGTGAQSLGRRPARSGHRRRIAAFAFEYGGGAGTGQRASATLSRTAGKNP